MIIKKTILISCLSFLLAGWSLLKAQTATFNYLSDTTQLWSVPACVTQVTIELWGGGGAGGYQNGYSGTSHWSGGSGAYMEGVLSGIEGRVLTLYVPHGGNYYTLNPYAPGGWPGGGGAGADVNYSEWGGAGGGYAAVKVDTTYYALAGGGGGGGSCGYGGTAFGGGGGNPNAVITAGSFGTNGGPGLLTSGGAGGSAYSTQGKAGTHLNGGQGQPQVANGNYGGGGGGAGWYGGGGGGDQGNAGGGGSSYPGSTYSFKGVTFTILSNLAGTTNSGASGSAVAPNAPVAGIGAGNYSGAGGNGYIRITYAAGFVQVTDTTHVISEVMCNGGTDGKACAFVTGGTPATYSYNWMPGGASTDTVTNLSAGIYTVTVSNTCGSTTTATVTLSQPAVLTDTAYALNNVLCNGGNNGSAIVLPSGGSAVSQYTYMWTPSLQTNATATGLSAGSYVVVVSDACGGSSSSSVTITQPNAMSIVTTVSSSVNCSGGNNGSGSATVSGGATPYMYNWTPVGGTTNMASNLTAGTYTLTVTDNNGCSNSAPLVITEPNVLAVSVAPTSEVACNGGATGNIQSTPTGGTMPFTYAWSNGQTNANASNVIAGLYTLTMVDMNGCVATATTTITQPTQLDVVSNVTVDSGSCTGTAWVVVTGGVYNYSYAWSNGNSTYNLHYVCGGHTYCCVITDGHGCTDTACVSILDVSGVGNVTAAASNISVYPNPNSGQFTVSVGAGLSGSWKIEMYNLLGEQVYSGLLNNQGANTQVNISNQTAGVYLYRVLSTADGHLAGEGKVVLQK